MSPQWRLLFKLSVRMQCQGSRTLCSCPWGGEHVNSNHFLRYCQVHPERKREPSNCLRRFKCLNTNQSNASTIYIPQSIICPLPNGIQGSIRCQRGDVR